MDDLSGALRVIRTTVARLRSSPRSASAFGAAVHRFEFNPVLTNDVVRAFERRHRVELPSEYRSFLAYVGDGGAGPYYGVFPLGMMDQGHGLASWEKAGDWLVGDLSAPFPHTDAWNLDFDPEDPEVTPEAFGAAEAANWAPARVNGAVPICHRGCGLRDWLVLAGPLRGHVWHDDRADWGGLSPVKVDGRRDTFLTWYLRWLEEAAWLVGGGGLEPA